MVHASVRQLLTATELQCVTKRTLIHAAGGAITSVPDLLSDSSRLYDRVSTDAAVNSSDIKAKYCPLYNGELAGWIRRQHAEDLAGLWQSDVSWSINSD